MAGKHNIALTLLTTVLATLLYSPAMPAGTVPKASPSNEEQCRYPNPYTLIGGIAGLSKVEYLPIGANWTLRWLLISSEGPLDGTAYVIGCDGKAIVQQRLGYVEQAKNGPEVARQDTLQVTYIPSSGTGINLQSVALLHFNGKSISVL